MRVGEVLQGGESRGLGPSWVIAGRHAIIGQSGLNPFVARGSGQLDPTRS